MRFKMRRMGVSLALILVAACGGGGGEKGPSFSVSQDSIEVTAETRDHAPIVRLDAWLSEVPDRQIYATVVHTTTGIESAQVGLLDDSHGQVVLIFKTPEILLAGTYRDSLTLKVCYDAGCSSQLRGSPRRLSVTYTITGAPPPPPEPALQPTVTATDSGVLSVSKTQRLPYPVNDPAYSKALDAIVTLWGSGLHVFHLATGQDQFFALPSNSGALGLSPDGTRAAVSHYNNTVSIVDLTHLGDSSALTTITDVPGGRPIIDGDGWTHIFATREAVRSISPTNSVEKRPFSPVYASMVLRLNPLNTAIYGIETQLSPQDLVRFTLRNGEFMGSRDSPYHGNYALCGNLWFSANGKRIFTACGNVFRSSDFGSQDMTFLGKIPRYFEDNLKIVSVSESVEAGEVAIAEGPRVSLFESQFLNATASYSLPPVIIDGITREQRPRDIFYSGDGTKKYIITWIPDTVIDQVLTVE